MLAAPEGYVRTFVDEGPLMAAILSEVLPKAGGEKYVPPVPAHYIGRLLAALERDAGTRSRPPRGRPNR